MEVGGGWSQRESASASWTARDLLHPGGGAGPAAWAVWTSPQPLRAPLEGAGPEEAGPTQRSCCWAGPWEEPRTGWPSSALALPS